MAATKCSVQGCRNRGKFQYRHGSGDLAWMCARDFKSMFGRLPWQAPRPGVTVPDPGARRPVIIEDHGWDEPTFDSEVAPGFRAHVMRSSGHGKRVAPEVPGWVL